MRWRLYRLLARAEEGWFLGSVGNAGATLHPLRKSRDGKSGEWGRWCKVAGPGSVLVWTVMEMVRRVDSPLCGSAIGGMPRRRLEMMPAYLSWILNVGQFNRDTDLDRLHQSTQSIEFQLV